MRIRSFKLVAGDVHRARPAAPASLAMAKQSRVDAANRKRCRLCRKDFLRIPPVHARPHHHAARQLNQADRAVSRGAPRAVRKDARVLRRSQRLPRISVRHPRPIATTACKATARSMFICNSRMPKNNNMGMPLPAGRVRVSKQDPADQTLEFIGEDTSITRHATKICC